MIPASLQSLASRFDPDAFDAPNGVARIRLEVTGNGAWDALIEGDALRLLDASGDKPDASLSADAGTWLKIARDLPAGMEAFRRQRLRVRTNLHLGVGFLAATGGRRDAGRLRFDRVRTARGTISYLQAGTGSPLVALHGLGATKASFLPTVGALASSHRVLVIDLPGFGDSDKPLAAAYDAPFFADWVRAFLDALEIDAAGVIGNSMGGRVALELGLRHPDRVAGLALLAPSLAWRRGRRWASYLRWVRPELGLVQPVPRPVVERLVQRLIPGARSGWAAAGIDEFLRSYLTPRGRAAFYAAARSIYLEAPDGADGFWTRLEELAVPSLFVWGRHDRLVPLAFARHVEAALPRARHVELNCGHVPQLEAPAQTHAALREFFAREARRRTPV